MGILWAVTGTIGCTGRLININQKPYNYVLCDSLQICGAESTVPADVTGRP